MLSPCSAKVRASDKGLPVHQSGTGGLLIFKKLNVNLYARILISFEQLRFITEKNL